MMEMSPDIVYGGSFVLHCSGNKPHIRKFGPLWLCSKGYALHAARRIPFAQGNEG